MNTRLSILRTMTCAAIMSLPMSMFAQAGATFTAGPTMNRTRIVPFLATLSDSRVVAFGGREFNFVSGSHADIYNPATNTFTEVAMNYPHDGSYGVKLSNGKYFIIAGSHDLGVAPGYTSTETFDPSTNTFTPSGNMNYARCVMGAAELANGKVLIAGAWYSTTNATYGEVYDPTGGTFTVTGSLMQPRANPLILPTNDTGAVLVGGYGVYGTPSYKSVEYYSSVDNQFHNVSTEVIPSDPGWIITNTGFNNHPSADYKMSDGRYLIGAYRTTPVSEYGLLAFNPATKTFSRINTTTSIMNSFTDGGFFDLVLDRASNVAYMLGVDSGSDPSKISLTAINLTTGVISHPTGTYTMPASEYLYPSLAFMPVNGKILMEGISTTTGDYFHATNKTYIITPNSVTKVGEITGTGNNVSCYPNPANNTITFSSASFINTNIGVKVYDMTGRTMINQVYSNVTSQITLAIQDLAEGVYIYELNIDGQIGRNKFIKQ